MEKELGIEEKDAPVIVVNQITEEESVEIDYLDISDDEYATRDESEFDWSIL